MINNIAKKQGGGAAIIFSNNISINSIVLNENQSLLTVGGILFNLCNLISIKNS